MNHDTVERVWIQPSPCSLLALSSYLSVLEVLQADGAHGAGVGAAGRPPGPVVALGPRAPLGAIGLGLQAADDSHRVLVERVLRSETCPCFKHWKNGWFAQTSPPVGEYRVLQPSRDNRNVLSLSKGNMSLWTVPRTKHVLWMWCSV